MTEKRNNNIEENSNENKDSELDDDQKLDEEPIIEEIIRREDHAAGPIIEEIIRPTLSEPIDEPIIEQVIREGTDIIEEPEDFFGFGVFICYSGLDSDYFQIKKVAKSLEAYPEIDKVFFWEEDSGENIVRYMEEKIEKSKVFVMFCSKNTKKSKSVRAEWEAAFQLRQDGKLKIVPVYENKDNIPTLLRPMLNVEFNKDNFQKFIEKLKKEILR